MTSRTELARRAAMATYYGQRISKQRPENDTRFPGSWIWPLIATRLALRVETTTDAGSAGCGLVADKPTEKAHQNRREDRELPVIETAKPGQSGGWLSRE